MTGLLDWIDTPEGIGLLSAVAGGMAGARKGTPYNNVGRAGIAGLVGYQGEKDNQRQLANTAIADKYRTMQMNEIEQRLAQQQAQQKWKAGLPDMLKNRTQSVAPNSDTQLMAQSMGSQAAPEVVDNSQALNDYMMQPDSPYAEKLMERQLFPEKKSPIKLGAGDVLLDPNTNQPIYTVPSADKSPDKVRQYEYALSRGYDGSYIDFIRLIPELQAAYTVPFKRAGLAIDQANLGLREREADYTLPSGKPRQQTAPSFSVTAPDGNVYGFPSQAAADQFKRSIGSR